METWEGKEVGWYSGSRSRVGIILPPFGSSPLSGVGGRSERHPWQRGKPGLLLVYVKSHTSQLWRAGALWTHHQFKESDSGCC